MPVSLWPRVIATLAIVVGGALIAPTAGAEAAPHHQARSVAAGYLHTCAVTTRGAVRCWGWNNYGQLGNRSTTDSVRPVAVSGLRSKVRSVTAGSGHTCALTTNGKVWCWGDNQFGQLGNGSTTHSSRPVAVHGLGRGVKAISAGNVHTCAITSTGAAMCWGNNLFGALGDGSEVDSTLPVPVYGLTSGVRAIAAGYQHTCAISSTRAAMCWGNNGFGRLGNDSMTSSARPVPVFGLASGVKQIAAGTQFSCAVNAKNAAVCWGFDGQGQLGDDGVGWSLRPVGVHGLGFGVRAVKAGTATACALTLRGRVACWGSNDEGELGDNSTTSSRVPVPVYRLDRVAALTVGYRHTCVRTVRRTVKCWGNNPFGQLGNNTTTDSPRPVRVFGF